MKMQPIKDLISSKLQLIKLPKFPTLRPHDKQGPPSPPKTPSFVLNLVKLIEKYKPSSPFVISGITLLASLIIYLVLVAPLKSKTEGVKNNLNIQASELEKHLRKGKDIRNAGWIEAKEREIALIENELQTCKKTLAKRDEMIERVFTDINDEKIKDEALWKRSYMEKTDKLMRLPIYDRFAINRETMAFKTWEGALPSLDEIAIEQKRFWIQDEITNIIMKSRTFIKRFVALKFRVPPPVAPASTQALFTSIPFTLEIEIEPSKILYLISEILRSGLSFYIETINIESTADIVSESNKSPNTLNMVTIEAYAMDYVNDSL